MQTRAWKEYHLSRLMLGTVQFGLPYGVANRTGQPSYAEVRAIMTAAIDGGVNCFDTAAAYGGSEEVLGRALQELGAADRVVVVTKVRSLTPAEQADDTLAARTTLPQLTTVRQPLRAMGNRAVEVLIDRIKRQNEGDGLLKEKSIVFPVDLVPRASVGAPPAIKRIVPSKH